MATPELGPWQPVTVGRLVEMLAPAPFRWWVSGGHALDLHLGRSWRSHADTDLGVCRDDLPALRPLLTGWDLHVAAAGRLRPWTGAPLVAARHEDNLWCRPGPEEPWALDVTIGEGTPERWAYRRDPTVTVPWADAVLLTVDGTPYLAPELQVLFKSVHRRPKDDVDAAEVIPALDARRQSFLAARLPPGHPWQALL